MAQQTSRIRGFLSDSVVYGLGMTASRIFGMILVPVYAVKLTKPEFGLQAMFETFLALSVLVAQGGMAEAVGYLVARQDEDFHATLGAGIYLTAGLGAVMSVVVYCTRVTLGNLFFGGPAYLEAVDLLALTIFTNAMHAVCLASLRYANRARLYALLIWLEALCKLLLTVAFVVGCGWGVLGVMRAYAITYLLLCLLDMALFGGKALLRARRSLMRPLIKFGLAVLPSHVAARSELSASRLIVGPLVGNAALAVYSFANKVSQLPQLINMPMSNAIRPSLYRLQADDRQSFDRLTGLMAALVHGLVLLVAVFVPEIVRILGVGRYDEASPVSILLLAGMMLRASAAMVGYGALYKGKPAASSAVVVSSALLNLGLNFLLIPRYGIYGAAYAGLASTFCLAFFGALVSRRMLGFAFRRAELLSLATFAALIAFVVLRVDLVPLSYRLSVVLLGAAVFARVAVRQGWHTKLRAFLRDRKRRAPAARETPKEDDQNAEAAPQA